MRELNGSDIFDVIRIVNLLDLKLDDIFSKFREAADTDIEDEAAVRDRGMNLAKYVFELVMEKAETLQKPVHAFFAKLKGCSVEEIEALPLDQYFGLYTEFAQKKELKGFLQLTSSFSKKATSN